MCSFLFCCCDAQGEAPSGGNSRDKGSQLSSKPRSALVGVSAAAKACPQFTALVNHLIKILFVNLTEKSTSYPTVSVKCSFLEGGWESFACHNEICKDLDLNSVD